MERRYGLQLSVGLLVCCCMCVERGQKHRKGKKPKLCDKRTRRNEARQSEAPVGREEIGRKSEGEGASNRQEEEEEE